jgi:hypothetical protein
MNIIKIIIFCLGGLTAFILFLALIITAIIVAHILYKKYFHPVEYKVISGSTPWNFHVWYKKGLWCSKCDGWHSYESATKDEYESFRGNK